MSIILAHESHTGNVSALVARLVVRPVDTVFSRQ